jgi:hypothetical protein
LTGIEDVVLAGLSETGRADKTQDLSKISGRICDRFDDPRAIRATEAGNNANVTLGW